MSQSRPEAIAVQVQGQDRMLSPGDTIGTGSEATVRVVMPGLSGTLLRVRRLAHWRVEVMCQCDHVEVDGEETTRVSFPIGANQPRREVVLTHGAALLRARFMAGAASRPAPVPVPDVVSLPPPRPDPDTGPDVVERRIGDHTTFGRQSGGVDIQIDDPSVAALHATLDARGQGKYLLRDRNRGSATLVEGRAIRWARIGAGDRFSIGSSTFTLIAGGLLKERRRPVAVRLAVTGLTAWYPKGGRGIRGITFGLRPREVLAVLGPSGSGKSTLFKAMVGELPIQAGSIFFDDEDLTASPDLVRDRLGYAPQADYLHEALSARQVLSFAASFRHARDLGRRRRNEEVERIARILGITDRLDARVSELSGGQKKRLSIAVEVVRRPALLLLDEPTSGLDPGTAADVMDMLRQIAEEDCTVVLTTHATDQLRDVSRVLVVSRDGGEAYCGSPANVMPEFGVTSYSELMRSVRDHGAVAPSGAQPPQHRATGGAARPTAARQRPRRLAQLGTLVQRELALFRAGPPLGWAGPLLVPVLGAILACLSASSDGLGGAPGQNARAVQVLSLLTMAAVFAGQALTYGNLVAEYQLIRRERRTGVAASGAILAKLIVFGVIAVLQTTLLTGIFFATRPRLPWSLLGIDGRLEVWAALSLTAVAAMALGMLISAASKNLKRAVDMAAVAAIAQVALNGGLLHLEPGDPQWLFSLILPARWGMAAAASVIDLPRLMPVTTNDPLWQHRLLAFAGACAVLVAMAAVCTCATWLVLVRRFRRDYQ